jgi:hypothetical protein
MTTEAPNPMPWLAAEPCVKRGNPRRAAIFMDALERIIGDLNQNEELQKIFAITVSRALLVVADESDLRIEEAGTIPLTREQKEAFLHVLNEVITRNSL